MSLTEINAIIETFPVAGIDQSSQTFRDNFDNIKVALLDLDSLVINVIDDLGDVDTTTLAPTTDDLLVFDGTNWVPGISQVVSDTTPQLGGDLDVNGFNLGDGSNVIIAFVESLSPVNWLTISNAATGIAPTIASVGADINVDLQLDAKGDASVVIGSDTATSKLRAVLGSSLEISTLDDTVGRDITIKASNATTSSNGDGGDVDIRHGAGDGAGSNGSIFMRDHNGERIVRFAANLTGPSFNSFTIRNAVSGVAPVIGAAGVDANVDVAINPKGTGNVLISSLSYPNVDGTVGQALTTDGAGNLGFSTVGGLANVVEDTTPQLGGNLDVGLFELTNDGGVSVLSFASGGEFSVNNVEVVSSITTQGVIVRAVGTDTNIDLKVEGKGSGNVLISSLSYPNTDGSLGQFITTDGFGNLSFDFINISADTTPQLGGNLDVSGNQITSVSNGNIVIQPGGTGEIEIGFVLYSKRIQQTIVDNTTAVFLTYPATPQSATFVDYLLIRTASNVRTGTLVITNNAATATVVDTGADVGDVQVTFSVAINASNVEVSYIAAATASAGAMRYQTRRIEDT